MAKRPKAKARGGKGDAPAGEKANPADNMLFPSSKLIQDLAKDGGKATKRAREIIGAFGQQVSEAADKKHVDKKALGMARTLEALSDERLAITLPHLLKYIDDLGLAERASKQAEMFGQNEGQGAEGEETENEPDDGKVHRIRRDARKVMEEAGGNPPA